MRVLRAYHCGLPCVYPSAQTTWSRKVAVAYAQHLSSAQAAVNSTRPDAIESVDKSGGKPTMPVHVARPSIPCDKPLPLANVLEVQRLLFLLEAPEYCMRAFREHGVNGQDLIVLQEEDLEDSRFKFPKHVQRKVMRIPRAWRTFIGITGSHTRPVVSMDQYVAHYSLGRSADAAGQLQSAFRMVDINNNGILTFEEFLVGFSLLEAAVAEIPPPVQPQDSAAEAPSAQPEGGTAAALRAGEEAASAAKEPRTSLGWFQF